MGDYQMQIEHQEATRRMYWPNRSYATLGAPDSPSLRSLFRQPHYPTNRCRLIRIDFSSKV